MQLEADFRKGKQTPKDRMHLDGEVNTGLVAGRYVLPAMTCMLDFETH